MYIAFIDSRGVSELGGTVPAIFAKTSMIWTTMLYIFTNSNVRNKFICIESTRESMVV
jgi:hypothetical protein